jgi:hypothetical protein
MHSKLAIAVVNIPTALPAGKLENMLLSNPFTNTDISKSTDVIFSARGGHKPSQGMHGSY